MENKTALQELIEIIQEERKTEYHNYVLNFVYQKAIDLQEKEKQQIVKAYHDGQVVIFNLLKEIFPKLKNGEVQKEIDLIEAGKEVNEDAEDYYNKTYNK